MSNGPYDSIQVITVKEPVKVSRFVFTVEFAMTRTGETIIVEDEFSLRCAHPALAKCNELESGESYSLARVCNSDMRDNLINNYDVEHKSYTFHPPRSWSVHYIDQFNRKCKVELT